jgi:L-alanine-DL-glutamate epimerase-like enolase superfamily enzyme
MDAFANYRRWAFESAALDLALRQAGRSLAQALEREPRPVRFVVSKRIDSLEQLQRLLERYPGTRLKLDPTSDWTDDFSAALAATRAVDVVDLKGRYHGTSVDQPPDAALYERVARTFPDAWIEDPALTPETDAVLESYRDRITWDAPIHSVADVEALPFAPRTLNVKPSRFGQLRELLAFYDYCAERRIGLYGGGQFELGPGRGQIQALASLFNPDSPNDVAPGGYNETEPPDGLEISPLEPALAPA